MTVKLEKVDNKTAYENLLVKYAELEKENAELKERYNRVDIIGYDALKNLTKAKEIIKEYMRFEPMIGTCSFYSEEYEKTKAKAEQLLREIEK